MPQVNISIKGDGCNDVKGNFPEVFLLTFFECPCECFRMEMAQDWVSREQELPGVVKREMKTCLSEIYRERRNGKELRFLFEKQTILSMSLRELQKFTS